MLLFVHNQASIQAVVSEQLHSTHIQKEKNKDIQYNRNKKDSKIQTYILSVR